MKLVNDYIKIKDNIYEAMSSFKPVIALDSSLITHSLPYPINLETVKKIEKFLKENGVFLAVLSVTEGYINVGLTEKELEFLASSKNNKKIRKIERKDLPGAIAKKITGSLSISASMLISNMLGLRIMITDGIDGTFGKSSLNNDIFSDLSELENTNVTLVCTGVKPLFSLKETINKLRRLGVPVYGYKTSFVPNFYSGHSQILVDCYIDSLDEIVDILNVKKHFKFKGGQLLVTQVPKNYLLDHFLVENNSKSIKQSILSSKMLEEDMNLYFSEKMSEQTEGKSLISHSESLFYNAKVACILVQKFLKNLKDSPNELRLYYWRVKNFRK
ncbi:MAG: pseudouridine-5'-phosphate glycosidase, partial [Malacoplasma sp.]|nr:pseudouridine-5'-phosphate glycosidase [Malacoplasma sp.]